jgi:glycerol-3-phosphate dehydrogenase
MAYPSNRRKEILNEFSKKKYDIVVIGGGITGAGIALDAVSRGFSVALVEKQDFAAGTSSRSTKLIHGGLRYLKNFEIKIVRETGLERAIAYKNAPHLVRPEKMLLPLIENGTYGRLATSFGLWLYDVLAGVKGEDKRKMLGRDQTLKMEPLLRDDIIKGSGYYAEYRTDDARLTLEVLKTAKQKGAEVINYTTVDELLYKNGKIVGVKCQDGINQNKFEIKSDFVVNATGPWVDELRKKDNSCKGKRLHLTKGVHIVVPKEKLDLKQSVYFDVDDGRMIFAIPRQNSTYLGTTDTNYKGDTQRPEVSLEDVNYILSATNNMFPEVKLSSDDIISSWAGLRPLIHEDGKDPSAISRTDELFESETGLITIAGGKLTGYRLMAKKVLRFICDKKKIRRKCKTRRIRLSGGEFASPKQLLPYKITIIEKLATLNLPEADAVYLVHNYGKQTDRILAIYQEEKERKLVEAEALFALKYDGVCYLNDFYIRRTAKMYFAPQTIKGDLDVVATVFAAVLGWDEEKVAQEKKSVVDEIVRVATFK